LVGIFATAKMQPNPINLPRRNRTGHYVLGKNADRRALELIYHLDPFASLYACVRDSWC
jgi:hypothetical protein